MLSCAKSLPSCVWLIKYGTIIGVSAKIKPTIKIFTFKSELEIKRNYISSNQLNDVKTTNKTF